MLSVQRLCSMQHLKLTRGGPLSNPHANKPLKAVKAGSARTAGTSKVLLQGSDKTPLFTASRKDWMPNGLVESKKRAGTPSRQKAVTKGKNAKKDVDVGPFIILGAIVAATLYHIVPH